MSKRESAILRVALSGTGAKCVSVLATLAQVPIALHYLGLETYGLWIAVANALAALNLLDAGLGAVFQQKIAACFGRDEETRMQAVFATGALVSLALSCVLVFLGLSASFALPWADWLQVQAPVLRGLTPWLMACMLLVYLPALPSNMAGRLANATQLGHLASLWIALGSLANLGLSVLVVWLDLGGLVFAVSSMLIPAIQNFGLWVQLCRRFRWPLLPKPRLAWSEFRLLLGDSVLFSVPQWGVACVFSFPAFALTLAEGPACATRFNLFMRLFSLLLTLQLFVLTPLFSAYAEAQARGEHAWVGGAWRRSLLWTGLLNLVLLGLALVSQPLLRLWVGSAVPPVDGALLWSAVFWCSALLWMQPGLTLLGGLGRYRVLLRRAAPGLFLATLLFFVPLPGARPAVLHLWVSGALLLLGVAVPLLASAPGFVRADLKNIPGTRS